MPIDILMPALSPTMTEGTLAKWLVKAGETVSSGDVIAEIETDKATMEVEAVEEGTVGAILVAEGSEGVPVNSVIARLLEEGEDATALDKVAAAPAKVKASKAEEPTGVASVEVKADQSVPAKPIPAKPIPAKPSPASRTGKGGRVFATPLARRIAADKGLDLNTIDGSGPHGRIIKADVLNAKPQAASSAARGAASDAAASPAVDARAIADQLGLGYEFIKANGMMKTVAARMSQSRQTVPEFSVAIDCELDALLSLRKQINTEADGLYKLSVNDFVIKAAALALKAVPAANASWAGDGIIRYDSAHVSVAVALEGGLITPVVRNAEIKSLGAISGEVKDLAGRAKEGKLKPQEYQGGTFSVSNLGMFGIKQFDAVINTPEGAIMAVGAGEKRAVVKDGQLAIATVMTVTGSFDHRCINGADGAEFMAAFKKIIEAPTRLLV